jgi:hypothetical protein
MSAPARLCAFGLLLLVIFLAARAAGAALGPVTATYARTGGGSSPMQTGPMQMGTGPAGAGIPALVRVSLRVSAGRGGR